jgi:hypothetical protein
MLARLRVAPMNKDRSRFEKGPVWLILLIRIIVGQTGVSLFAGHAATLVHPTVVREMGPSKCILIASSSPIDENQIAGFNKLDLFGRERSQFCGACGSDICILANNQIPRKFDCWEHGDLPCDNRIAASAIPGIDRFTGLYDTETNFRKTDIICRCAAVVFSYEFNPLLAWNAKILNVAGSHADISPQLPVFSVLHNDDLVRGALQLIERSYKKSSGDQGINANSNSRTDFNSKFYALTSIVLFIGFIILFRKGFESFVQSSRLFGGAAIMLTGWLMGLTAVASFIS